MTNPDFLSIVVRRERRGYLWQLLDGMVAVARGTAAQKKTSLGRGTPRQARGGAAGPHHCRSQTRAASVAETVSGSGGQLLKGIEL